MENQQVWEPTLEIRNRLFQFMKLISSALCNRQTNLSHTDHETESLISLLYITSSPAHPEFLLETSRYRSYPSQEQWSTVANGQPISKFVDAGFFKATTSSEEDNDHVKCFFCNLGLKDWSPGDDPWFEHARFSPLCFYVKSARGLQYLQEVSSHRTEAVKFPRVYSQSNHGGLLDTIIDLWNSDRSKAVISAGIHTNNVLLYVSRIWIRERRFPSLDSMMEDLQQQKNQSSATFDIAQILENYMKFKSRNQQTINKSTQLTTNNRTSSAPRAPLSDGTTATPLLPQTNTTQNEVVVADDKPKASADTNKQQATTINKQALTSFK